MSRKPIFANDNKQTQNSQIGFQQGRQADTRVSQMKKTELNLQVYDKNASPFSGISSQISVNKDEMMNMSSTSSRFMVEDVQIQRIVREMLDSNTVVPLEFIKKELFILQNQQKESNKQIDLLKQFNFDQKQNQTQMMNQVFQQIQQFEKSFTGRISVASDQLVKHQENFQLNYDSKLNEIKKQCEQTKLNIIESHTSSSNLHDQIKDINQKISQIEANTIIQIKALQPTYQTQIQASFKKMMEKIENQFKDIHTFIDSRTFNKDIDNDNNNQLEQIKTSMIANDLKQTTEFTIMAQQLDHRIQNLEILNLENKLKQNPEKVQGPCIFSFNSNFQDLKTLNTKIDINDDDEYNYSDKKKSVHVLSENFEYEYEDKKNMSFQLFLQNQSQEQQKFKESTVTHSVEVHEYIGNTFIEDDEERTPKALRTEQSDVVEIGNKESFLERMSEINRLPEIPENAESHKSIVFPLQPQNSICENFIAHSNMPMTESEYKNIAVETNYDEEVEVTYQLDDNGYLMDENDQYILDDDGNMIQLTEWQIDYLKQRQINE